MKTIGAKIIALNAISMALICVATSVVQIPIPLGYMHLGNTCILLISTFCGGATGFLAGGIGSALADLLTGYTQWIVPTLVIKGIMGYTIAKLSKDKNGNAKMLSWRTAIASAAGILIMVTGYFAAGSFLYGGIAAGAAQLPGLFLEGFIGIVLFYALGFAFEKASIPKMLRSFSEEHKKA